MTEHTMAQDMGEAHDYANGGGENAFTQELVAQIKRDSKATPRMDSQAHEDHVKSESDRLGANTERLDAARDDLAKVYADQAQREAAATMPDGFDSTAPRPTETVFVSPEGDTSYKLVSEQIDPANHSSSSVSDEAERSDTESAEPKPTQEEEPARPPAESTLEAAEPAKDQTEPEAGVAEEATAAVASESETEAAVAESTETGEPETTDSPEANTEDRQRTIDHDGQKVIWSEQRAAALGSPNYSDQQKQEFLEAYLAHDQAAVTRGDVDASTLAELGWDVDGNPLRTGEPESSAEPSDEPDATPPPEPQDTTIPEPDNSDIPRGTFDADDGPTQPPPSPDSEPMPPADPEPPRPDDDDGPEPPPFPDQEPMPPVDPTDMPPGRERVIDPRDESGEFSQIIGRAARELWEAFKDRHVMDKMRASFDNWRNNSRRRSERLRDKFNADGRPDTGWQKWRVEHKEKSEERRAAFWDKWLGTRIGQAEAERPGGREGRQTLITRPEAGMDRAIRMLADLRNDQERFRGIGLNRSREKARRIEGDFRELVSQEVADKVEGRLAEAAGYRQAADIIRNTLARSEEESHLDGEALEEYIAKVSSGAEPKGEFRPMAHVAQQYLQKFYDTGSREDLATGIAMLDTIKNLNDAHEAGEIDDATILRVNQLVYEGKDSAGVIAELERGVSPEEIQATTISSILDVMQKVDQARAETKTGHRKNDGAIRKALSSPGWKKIAGTAIAGVGTVGIPAFGPLGVAVASSGIFMARQAGMRERVENKTNKKAGQQAALIDRVTEDPVMRAVYRRLDVTPQTRGAEVVDLPSREDLGRTRLDNYNARELVEALAEEGIESDTERRQAVTEQIIDSMLTANREQARTKLTRRIRSTSFSAAVSSLPIGAAATGLLYGDWASRVLFTIGSVGTPLFGAWRQRKAYAAPATPAR